MWYEKFGCQHSLSKQDIPVWQFLLERSPYLHWWRHKTDTYIASMPCAHYPRDGMENPFRDGGYDINISGDEDGLCREN